MLAMPKLGVDALPWRQHDEDEHIMHPIEDSYELEDNSIGLLECSAGRRHRSECAVTRAGTDSLRQNG